MTTTAVPSKMPEDFALNIENLDKFTNSTSSTFTDRLGGVKKTMAGAAAEAEAKLALLEAAKNTAINSTIPAVMAGLAAFNPRGAWATGTAYALKDVYTANGVAYVATLAHTSTSVAADLGAGKVTVHQGAMREELAASGGSGLLGHIADGAGAVVRTLQDVARDSDTTPEGFGAVGSGVVDDTLALRAAITAAGVGGRVRLKPGKTYLLSGRLSLLAGQTLEGYGAAIKRCNQISSATTTGIAIGPAPVIQVASGALFAVGQDVTVYSGATYDPRPHRIAAIAGNNLTVESAFTVAFPSGGTVITCAPLLTSAANNVRVLGLEINGNRANNTGFAKWETHAGIYISGRGVIIRDCYIHDEVAEGIELGGDGCIADNNFIMDCGGNGVHFTGCAGGKARGNYVKNVNILGASPGHADGGIIFSNVTGDSIITGNYVDTAISGIASIDSVDNSSVVISGNVIKNCTTTAIEGIFPSTQTGGKVSITGNLIYDSQRIDLNYTPGFSASYGPMQWVISGNYLENTIISIGKAFGVSVTGNILSAVANTTTAMISVADSQTVTVANNQITGGMNGIYSSGVNLVGLKISGNTFTNQYQRAVNMTGTADLASSIEGNTIIVYAAYTTSGYYGITAPNNCAVLNNIMNIQVTAGNSAITCPNGGSGINGALVQGNIIRSSGLTYAIRASGGSQNNIIVNNMTQQTVSNAGGAGNTVTGNVTIF